MTTTTTVPAPGSAGISREELVAWVHASCTAQGLPLAVSDPAVLTQVATLLTGKAPARSKTTTRGHKSSRQSGGQASTGAPRGVQR